MKVIKSEKTYLYKSEPDIALVQAYKASLDNAIIGELFNRYQHIVMGVALKYLKSTNEAQDITLEIFNNLFDQLIKYKIEDFKSWLLVVTRNYCLKVLHENNRFITIEPAHSKYLSVDFMENEHEIAQYVAREDQYEQLEQAIKKLKPEQQTCVALFYFNDKTYAEIAETTGYSVKKVKSYIQNGKRNLQILLTK